MSKFYCRHSLRYRTCAGVRPDDVVWTKPSLLCQARSPFAIRWSTVRGLRPTVCLTPGTLIFPQLGLQGAKKVINSRTKRLPEE